MVEMRQKTYRFVNIRLPVLHRKIRLSWWSDEVHQTGLGLGSGYLTHALALGEQISCRVRSNPAFYLVQNDRLLF
jgi:hypothetical protein